MSEIYCAIGFCIGNDIRIIYRFHEQAKSPANAYTQTYTSRP